MRAVMRALACITAFLLGPLSLFSEGRTELELLRSRCTEQERQITALEKEIEQLREQVAFERRRARHSTAAAAKPATPAPAPAVATSTGQEAGKKESPQRYAVKAGDTISAIARRYHTSSKSLMALNGIEDPTRLSVGQVLQIPGTQKTVAASNTPAPAPAPAAAPKPKGHTYTVKSGDTLSKVARMHGMTFSQITSLNPDIEPDRLLVGQRLQVSGKPVASSQNTSLAPSKTHTVATNDPKPAPSSNTQQSTPKPAPKPIASITVSDEISFGAFAAKYGTTPERLNALNGLTLKSSTVLAKGSELYVATNN